MMKYYAAIVGDTRNRLIGPFQSQEDREVSINFNLFDYPWAVVLRLDLRDGNLVLKELAPSPPVTRHVPHLTLFNPDS